MPGPLQIDAKLDPAQALIINAALLRFPQTIGRKVLTVIHAGLVEARGWMIANRLTGGPKTGRTTSLRLAARTYGLIRALEVRAKLTHNDVEGKLYVNPAAPGYGGSRTRPIVYGLTQEYGAHIRPLHGGLLTIPLTPEAEAVAGPRLMPGLFWIQSVAGNLLLVRREDGELVPEWLGRTEVTIPPRPFIQPTADRYVPKIFQAITVTVEEALLAEAA